MAGIENPLSAYQVEPHDGGAGPHLLGDVEAALAALKVSAVLDATQTVEAMELMRAEIAELRAELDEGRAAITPPPNLPHEHVGNHYEGITYMNLT
jgi:hypothetical protein